VTSKKDKLLCPKLNHTLTIVMTNNMNMFRFIRHGILDLNINIVIETIVHENWLPMMECLLIGVENAK